MTWAADIMKTLILGMGNPILTDDGVGIRVVREIEAKIDEGAATVLDASVSGLGLLDLLAGYDKAIIVDAIHTGGEAEPGEIMVLSPDSFEASRRLSCIHDVDFATALDLGKKLGIHLPQEIVIYAIEASDTTTFSEELTPEVEQAIPACVEMVLEELQKARAG